MAVMLNFETGRRVHLRTEHLFGRSYLADTVLDHADASQLHASIRWTGQVWELRDHSRNGVLVDNRPAPSNGAVALNVGAMIAFCRHGGSTWMVEDLDRPSCVLWPLSAGGPVISLSAVNQLPTAQDRELSIQRESDGRWYCDQDGRRRQLRDGDEVRMGGERWCFLSGQAIEDTMALSGAASGGPAAVLLHFHVSLDEEHVSLQIVGDRGSIGLGERAHHYCLLTLARMRLRDVQRGVEEDAQGWVDVDALARMLRVDTSHLNIQIFRARRQISHSMPLEDPRPDVVERRRGAVRFGPWAARIVRGSSVEGVLEPLWPTGGDPERGRT